MKINLKKSKAGTDFSGAMTDISFLLIIFFLVTSVFISTQGILLRLPDGETAPRRLLPEEVIAVEILSQGEYQLENSTMGIETLGSAIALRAASLAEPILVVSVTKDILYQEVLAVLEVAKRNGASSFSIRYQDSDPRGLKIEQNTINPNPTGENG